AGYRLARIALDGPKLLDGRRFTGRDGSPSVPGLAPRPRPRIFDGGAGKRRADLARHLEGRPGAWPVGSHHQPRQARTGNPLGAGHDRPLAGELLAITGPTTPAHDSG